MVELDLGHLEAAALLGLVPETVLERREGILSAEVYVDRLLIPKLHQCVDPHRRNVLPIEHQAIGRKGGSSERLGSGVTIA